MQVIVKGNLAEILAPLQNLPEKAQRAMREGLQEGGNKVRTSVRKALKPQMGVLKYGTIVANTTGTIANAGMNYIIRGTGKGLPIKEFKVSGKAGQGALRWSAKQHWKLQERTGSGRFGPIKDVPPEVTASPWSVSRTFKRSFVGSGGYRAAIKDGGRYKIRALYGPSVAKEIIKDASLAAFQSSVQVDVAPAIEKRLARIIGS